MNEKTPRRGLRVLFLGAAIGLSVLLLLFRGVAQTRRPDEVKPVSPFLAVAGATVSYGDHPNDNNFYVTARSGSPIVALQDGVVSTTELHDSVAIFFPDSERALLISRSVRLNVRVGQKISAGDIIGWFPDTIVDSRIFVGVLGDTMYPEELLRARMANPATPDADDVRL